MGVTMECSPEIVMRIKPKMSNHYFFSKTTLRRKKKTLEESISVQIMDGIDRDFGVNIEKSNMLFDGDNMRKRHKLQ